MNITPKELQDMTDDFLKAFLEKSYELNKLEDKKRDDLFAFHVYLAETLINSKVAPLYDEEHTILLGMASFDEQVAKQFFNKRIQGFVNIIEKRIKDLENQDDFRVENVKTKSFEKDDFKFDITHIDNKMSCKTIPCKTKCENTTFDVSNSRSGFKGNVVIKREMSKEFINDNEFIDVMIVDSVDFYTNKNKVMSIDLRYNYDTNTYYEEGTIHHFKYIADINSFYQTLVF